MDTQPCEDTEVLGMTAVLLAPLHACKHHEQGTQVAAALEVAAAPRFFTCLSSALGPGC